MKNIVSVSLGSSARNKSVNVKILDEDFCIQRIGTDGDVLKAVSLIEEFDGKVDAFGIGGTDLYIVAGGRRYTLRDARKLAQAAQESPIVDGSGLKDTLERRVINYLHNEKIIDFTNRKILQVCSVDRFGMAEASVKVGADMIFGDLIFGLGIPIPLKKLSAISLAARIAGPIITRVPMRYLYPTGEKQSINTPKYGKYYNWADIISGDFHYIKKYMPLDLTGKIILTNTVTEADIEELKKRRVKMLITTTPGFDGRSFGTNVMEAVLVAISGKRPEELTSADYHALLDKLNFKPRIERF